MFSLLEKPQQSAPTASGTVPSATPLRGAVGARESSAVAEAPTSSAGAASTAVPAAAPATGGTVFPTTSVGGAARAPTPVDETAVSKAAPATGGTVFPTASVGGRPGCPLLQMKQRHRRRHRRPAVQFPRLHHLGGQSGRASRLLEQRQQTLQRRRRRRPAVLLPLIRRWKGRLTSSR